MLTHDTSLPEGGYGSRTQREKTPSVTHSRGTEEHAALLVRSLVTAAPIPEGGKEARTSDARPYGA